MDISIVEEYTSLYLHYCNFAFDELQLSSSLISSSIQVTPPKAKLLQLRQANLDPLRFLKGRKKYYKSMNILSWNQRISQKECPR